MRHYSLLLSALLLGCALSAQVNTSSTSSGADGAKPSFAERLYYGGNIGLSFGDFTVIQANPLIGYRVTEKYSAGIGPNYTYRSFNDVDQHIYGGSIFNRLLIYEGIFAQADFERLFFQENRSGSEQSFSSDFTALLVGGGLRQPLGGRAGATLIVQYDILQDENSLYDGPIIRGGVSLGF